MESQDPPKRANGVYQHSRRDLDDDSDSGYTKSSAAADETVVLKMRQQVHYSKLPWGIWILEKLGCCCVHPTTWYAMHGV